jgi:hypothetical protein
MAAAISSVSQPIDQARLLPDILVILSIVLSNPMILAGHFLNEAVLHLADVAPFQGISVISDRRLPSLLRPSYDSVTGNPDDLLAPKSRNGARWGAVLR